MFNKVLIETYWNVNMRTTPSKSGIFFVLIETYWNINSLQVRSTVQKMCVLIETYWNVNVVRREIVGYCDVS